MDASWVRTGRSCRVVVLPLAFITTLSLFFPHTGAATYDFFPNIGGPAAACVSSCGKISNISYPFRQKGDPDECGYKKLELDCVNDVAVLRILSGEFYVQSINYSDYTIRLADPNFDDSSNCSSLPRYFLYEFNFSRSYSNDNEENDSMVDDRFEYAAGTFGEIIYMKCTGGVVVRDSTYYVDTSGCLDHHIYIATGNIRLSDLETGCHVIASTPVSLMTYEDSGFLNYSDLHRKLVSGFDLSWGPCVCEITCGSTHCNYFAEAGSSVQCTETDYCPHTPSSYHHCSKLFAILGTVSDILLGILNGMYFAITFRPPSVITTDDEVTPFYPSLDALAPAYIGYYGLISLVAVRVLFGVTCLLAFLIFKWRKRHSSIYENIEHFLQDNDLKPIRYSYREIKKMTRGFKDKIGEGGFGTVYKGKLRSGYLVAIKMLDKSKVKVMLDKSKANGMFDKSKANVEQFMSEVSTIGRIHHIHVVRLIGFCVEGSKRVLVYEYMANGSLDKFIFHKGSVPLSYQKIYEISLGVAHGIAYLHHGCDMKIFHFDIKPHNILLDENFIPKISDFGLANLCPIDNSIIPLTAAKGTYGYMAPEVYFSNVRRVSYKADVYSFGKLLIEMASRRRNSDPCPAEHLSHEDYFPLWLHDQFTQEKDIELLEGLTDEEKIVVKKMFIIGWWCIQLKPVDRPSMNKVVEMLEVDVENLQMPPKPLLYPQEIIARNHGSNSDHASCSGFITSGYASNDIPENSASNGGE